jgi:hypothetical protein
MFSKPTVLIVGAGASAEYGLPVGETLKSQLAADLRFRFEAPFNKQVSGSRDLYDLLQRRYPNNLNSQNTFLKAGSELSDALPAFISIDEALHFFSDREEVVQIGKLAAAQIILRAEAASKLTDKNGEANLSSLSETWLPTFLSMVLGSLTKGQIDGAFKNIAIVNFNYDRTIEHYLYWALQKIAGLKPGDAANALSTLRILRPYGSLGPLDWESPNDGVKFGSNVHHEKLFHIAGRIRTYTEQTIENDLAERLKSTISRASTVLFLGFGYHQQNMRLLEQSDRSKVRAVFATVFGIDDRNHAVIDRALRSTLRSIGVPALVPMRGSEMLQKMRPSISLAISK